MSHIVRRLWLMGSIVVGVAAPAWTAPEVTVTTVASLSDGVLTGRLLEFSLEKGLTLEPLNSGENSIIPTADIIAVQVRTEDRSGRPPLDRVDVRLSGGDRLIGRPVGASGDLVHVESRVLGRVAVPLERIDRWLTRAAREPRHGGGDAEELPQQEDVLVLVNGDMMRGTVLSVDQEGFALETDAGTLTVPHDRIASADLVADPPVAETGAVALIRLTDGSRLTGRQLAYSGENLTFEAFSGDPISCPIDAIARIDFAGGKWAWISDMTPISVRHTPMLSLHRAYVVNANVLGGPMRIAERTFDHGLGAYSESSLLYELAGQYREFVTWIGVDDAGGPLSDVSAEIRVDGRTVYRKDNLRQGQLVGPVRLDVGGAGRIELLTLFGENASIQDVFNWADAGLVR